MRRITVYQDHGTWHLSSNDRDGQAAYRTILDAANAARTYGDTLKGEAPGYVVRLQTSPEVDLDQSITLHSECF